MSRVLSHIIYLLFEFEIEAEHENESTAYHRVRVGDIAH